MKGHTYMSPGLYRNDRTNRIVRSINARKDGKGAKGSKGKRKEGVRGKEVSIRQSASVGQVIYGRMRVGGSYSFLETSQESHAYLMTGTANHQIAWTARAGGVAGNSITVTIIVAGTNPTLTCTVLGSGITINAKSTGGTSQSTADQVIAAVRANPAADALVAVNRGDGNGNGNVLAFSTTALSNGGGTWLHHVITLAAHEIESVESLYLDERLVTFGAASDPRWATGVFANRCFMAVQFGSDNQEAQGDLKAQIPTRWTSNHRQRGCAHVYLITVWDSNTYPNGMPDVSFLVKGKKCYDPRSLQTVWTQNAALIIADYLTNTKYGLSFPYADIDETALIAAANICDQDVNLNGGGTEKRYTINGSFDCSMSPRSVLEEMAAAMGGDIVYQGGKWFIYPATYRSPSIALNESQVRGEVQVTTKVSRRDNFNSVRGTFSSPQANYNEDDFPIVKNSTYISEDGKQIWEDLELNFVTSSAQAQRLAKIELERVRQGIEVAFPLSLSALRLQVCDTFYYSDQKFGWVNKVFEVRDLRLRIDPVDIIGVNIIGRETASGVFGWNSGEETVVDLAPNTTLPDPGTVEAPTNLTLTSGTSELYIRGDGTVFARLKVSWTATVNIYVLSGGRYEIQYKKSADSTWQVGPTAHGDATFVHILDVQDSTNYDVRIRAVNSIGTASNWVSISNHFVVGKSAPPSDVTGFAAVITDDGIRLSWNEIPDLDNLDYELRKGGTNWATSTLVGRIDSSDDGVPDGVAYLYPYRTAGPLTLRVKARDTTFHYSQNEATLSLTLVGPNPIQNFLPKVVDNNVLLDWTDPDPSTFSVYQYDVYKGDTFATAVKIGTVFGTFHTYVERTGGTFTYWVVAIDAGGNRSTEVSGTVTVAVPDDYYFNAERNPINEGTEFLNAIIGDVIIIPDPPSASVPVWLPVSLAAPGSGPWFMLMGSEDQETFEQWWDSNGWTTLQDAIDDGFIYWLQPGTTSPGYLEMYMDFGVILGSVFIDWVWSEVQLGDPTIYTPTISVSTNILGPWTDYPNAVQVFGSNFRYLKLRLDFEGTSNLSLSRLDGMEIRLALQREEETGIAEVDDADAGAGGTEIFFTKEFLDVEDIQLTAEGTTSLYAVLNFTDVPDPESFRVLLFDEDGTAVDGTVRYRVRGALHP